MQTATYSPHQFTFRYGKVVKISSPKEARRSMSSLESRKLADISDELYFNDVYHSDSEPIDYIDYSDDESFDDSPVSDIEDDHDFYM